jgi:hypothetical protein
MAKMVETYWAVNVLKAASDSNGKVKGVKTPVFRNPIVDPTITHSGNTHVVHTYHADGSHATKRKVELAPNEEPQIIWDNTKNGEDLVRAHVQLMVENGLDLGQPVPAKSQKDPFKFWSFLFSEDTDLAEGIRRYVGDMKVNNKMCAFSAKEQLSCVMRDQMYRNEWFVQPEEQMQFDYHRGVRHHAGICPTIRQLATTVPLAKDFFKDGVQEPKRPLHVEAVLYDAMKFLDAPIVGGVTTGLFEGLILSMEVLKFAGDDGLIAHTNRQAREALIGLWMAAFVAAGRHSVLEMLLTAKAMGYFQLVQLPRFSLDLKGSPVVRRFMSEPASFGYRQTLYQLVQRLEVLGVVSADDAKQRLRVNAKSLGDEDDRKKDFPDFERLLHNLERDISHQ